MKMNVQALTQFPLFKVHVEAIFYACIFSPDLQTTGCGLFKCPSNNELSKLQDHFEDVPYVEENVVGNIDINLTRIRIHRQKLTTH